jgi:DegV family protein with EDD domain
VSVKIVTDSTSDLPKEIAEELGITVIPLNVHFDLDTFRDGVDIQPDQFYHRLLTTPSLPKTSAPAPGLFHECYERLLAEGEDIVSIHISTKLSGTHEAAMAGKRDLTDGSKIEIIDSSFASMGTGLLAIAAAKAARDGATMDEVVKLVRDSIKTVFIAVALDTLEFLQKGGRVGKAQAWLGSLLSIKPMISLRDGEVVPLDRVRTRSKATARIYELLEQHLPAREMAVVYSTDREEADKVISHLRELYPEQSAYLARFGPVLGTYVGPNSLAIVTLN